MTSPYGSTLHHRENATHGQFAFTTNEAGQYLACFWVDGHNPGGGDVSVNIDWKTGIAAKDWESVARKEKIEVRTSHYLTSIVLNYNYIESKCSSHLPTKKRLLS